MYSDGPYVKAPPIAKATQRLALIATYMAMAIVGFTSITAVTVAYLVPLGWAVMFFSAIAIFGVISGLYRFEWGSLPFIIAICLIKAVTLIPVTIGFSAWLLVAISAFMGYRLVYLTLIAKKLRNMPSVPTTTE